MALLQAVVIGWLPGAVIYHAPWFARDRRAALAADERLFWQVLISVVVSLSAVLALAALGRYSLPRVVSADVALAIVAAAASRFRLRLGAAAPRATVWCLIPIALILLGLWRFFPPSEYIIGGKDPGVYLNEGVQIAQRGALAAPDPTVAAVPNFARDLFFPSENRTDYYSGRFMGFYIQEPGQGHVIGQFPHLFPAAVAVGYGLDGLTGARRAVGVFALLGVLAVYFAGARLVGRPAAGAAAGLLALHAIEVWFGRYPNAEVVMQPLLFGALLANARAHVDGDTFFAPLAGLLLGLLVFLRFDAVLGIAGVAAGLCLTVVTGGRLRWSFIVTLTAALLLASAYLLGPMRAYAYLPIVFLSNLPVWQDVALVVLTGLTLGALIVGSRSPALSRVVTRDAPTLVAAVVCAAAVYALYWRQPGGKLTDYDAYALRTYTYLYVTLPALLAALFGYALLARQRFWRDPALFVTVAIFALFFFYKIRIVPEQFWMARRFLPVILPATLLFAAGAAMAGAQSGSRVTRLLRGGLGLLFLVLLGLQYERVARPLLAHVEYAGIIPKIEEIAGTIGDDDLLIVESRDASDTHVLGLPLAYIYDRNVLLLRSRLPDKSVFASFLDWAHTRYGRVLFMGGGGTDLLSPRWDVRPIAGERFQVPEYDVTTSTYPRGVNQKEFDYSLYMFVPPDPSGASGPVDLDVGTEDDLHILRFHAKERVDGRSFRWSRDVSYISLTRLPAGSREVTLWMDDGGRPAAAPIAEVTVSLQVGVEAGKAPSVDRVLGTVRVGAGFKPYTVAIPADLADPAAAAPAPVRLKLATAVWNPQQVLGSGDNRALGVMVDRVTVK
ncbi:MAG: hypothetical protein ABIX28_15405 [Vicinamibacterales bacterium]